MPVVIGVRFKDSGKTYFFDPLGLEALVPGDGVIVETVRGPELAKVAQSSHTVNERDVVGELKPVLRRAEFTDYERLETLNAHQEELMARCTEKVEEHKLPMRLVKAEYSFDGSRLTFYFTAEKRVDFRILVRDLARTFRARIELRQIGPRDEAKLLGGIGPCGRLLCCATFLPDYARVSIKMAKDQDLPLNPTKISGVCGRLLCCLSYEHEQYLEIKAELPRKGAWVQTPEGPGEVALVNVVRETVTVELASSGVHEEFKPSQLQTATRQVVDLARSRAEEGITPVPLPERRVREPKHTGERRLLRDEVDNPEVLEALAMLEEGPDESSIDPRRPTPDPRRPAPDNRRPRQQASDARARQPEMPNRSRQSPTAVPSQPPRREHSGPARPHSDAQPKRAEEPREQRGTARGEEQRERSGAPRRRIARGQRPPQPSTPDTRTANARPPAPPIERAERIDESPRTEQRDAPQNQRPTEQQRATRRRRKRSSGE